jgi:hypothetical protein
MSPTLCPIYTNYGLSRQIFVEVPIIKFEGNPSSGGLAATYGQTWPSGAFHCFANALAYFTFVRHVIILIARAESQ